MKKYKTREGKEILYYKVTYTNWCNERRTVKTKPWNREKGGYWVPSPYPGKDSKAHVFARNEDIVKVKRIVKSPNKN